MSPAAPELAVAAADSGPGGSADLPDLQLLLPVSLAAVEMAREAVSAHLAPLELAPRTLYLIELVLEELQMNLLMHGFDDPSTGQVRIELSATADHVTLHIADNGRPFDPTTAATTQAPTTLDEARVGGLGLPLVRRSARHIGYERRDGRNHLKLEFARG